MTDANPHTTSPDSRRWRRIAGVLALAAMLTLAGCNGILGGDQQNTTTSNATVTPVDVPTDQPTASPAEQLVPGLTTEGVTNAGRLLQSQTAFLENHSTVTQTNTSVVAPNGTVLFSIHQTVREGRSGEEVALSANYTGSISGDRNVTRLEGWKTDEGTYTRRTFENGTTAYSQSANSEVMADGMMTSGALGPSGLSTYLSDADQGNVSVVTRETNGLSQYLVSGNLSESYFNTNYRLTIDEQGVTRDLLVVRPNPTETGEEIRGRATIESTDNESLEAPAWLSEAEQQTRPPTSTMPTATETATSLTIESTETETNVTTNDPAETTATFQ